MPVQPYLFFDGRSGADAARQDLLSPSFGMVADRFCVTWMVIVLQDMP